MILAGQRLQQQRLKKGLSIEEVAKGTKIQASFLLAIEKGEYQKLPSSTYAQGFVGNYAQFLGLPKKEIMALFRREFDADKSYQVLPQGLTKAQEFPVRRWSIPSQAFLVFIIFILLLLYIGFQYKAAFFNPSVSLIYPAQNAKVKGHALTVKGKVDANSTVSVNGQPASVAADGTFTKIIDVFLGKTTIQVKVVNQFGKQTVIDRSVTVTP